MTEQMTMEDSLYKQYMLARRYAWARHDELMAEGATKDLLYKDPEYIRLCEKEHEIFERYRVARDQAVPTDYKRGRSRLFK